MKDQGHIALWGVEEVLSRGKTFLLALSLSLFVPPPLEALGVRLSGE